MAPPVNEPALPAGVRKEVLTPASDQNVRRPGEGDEVEVHYVGRFRGADAVEFDSSRARDEPLTFKLGAGKVIKCWDLAVATMRKGELSRFVCSPELAYGEAGVPGQPGEAAKIPSNATLVFDIELLSWKSEGDLFDDGSVLRSVLQTGSGYCSMPKDGSEVCCTVIVSTLEGRVLDEHPRLNYFLGSGKLGPLSRPVDRALEGMKQNGEVSLHCSGGHTYEAIVHNEVIVKLTLHHIFEIEDVSPDKDGSVSKRCLADNGGDYGKPRDTAMVRVRVESLSDSQGQVLTGCGEPSEFAFVLGDGEVCDALEFAILGMHKGERAGISADASYFQGKPFERMWPFGEISGKLSLDVELQVFSKVPASWDMSSEEKSAYAYNRKECGSKLFKAQRYRLALQRYAGVVSFIQMHQGAGEMKLLCELNRAACFLKLGDGSGAKKACSAVLMETDPDEDTDGSVTARAVKALYRRASAQLLLHEFAEAAADLREILKHEPANKEAQRLLAQVKSSAKEEKEKSSFMFSKMHKAFGGFAEEEEKRVKDVKEAHAADLAKKGAAAKAEAAKWREGRGKTICKEESKDDFMRAQQSMADMQTAVRKMEMKNRGWDPDDDE